MHTLVLAGSLLAASAGLLSLSFTPPEVELFDDATIRSSVMRAPTDEVYSAWATRLVHASVDRPPTEIEALRAAPPDSVIRCEECRRILVRTPESGL
jgi:hypothetical protein